MKHKTDYRIGIGASSILVILVVLALTALSLLSYNSAHTNKALTARNRDMTVAYYDASATAQRCLAELDAALLAHRDEATDIEAWRVALQKLPFDIELTDIGAEIRFDFSVDAGSNRSIEVSGVLTPAAATRYRVTRHELVNNEIVDTRTTLTVLR